MAVGVDEGTDDAVGVVEGVAVGVAVGVVEGVAVGVVEGVAVGVVEGADDAVAVGVAEGVAVGVADGADDAVAVGVGASEAVGVVEGTGDAVGATVELVEDVRETGALPAAAAAGIAIARIRMSRNAAAMAAAMSTRRLVHQLASIGPLPSHGAVGIHFLEKVEDARCVGGTVAEPAAGVPIRNSDTEEADADTDGLSLPRLA